MREAEGKAAPRSKDLILLGTVHSDPMGFARTRDFLDTCLPDLILLELSPFALSYRKEHAPFLLKTLRENLRIAAGKMGVEFSRSIRHPRIAPIFRQISLPFEYRAARKYSRKTGTIVIPVDYSGFSREWIGTWPELISTGNLEQLLREDEIVQDASEQYWLAARRIDSAKPVRLLPAGSDSALWQEREHHLAGEITREIERRRPARPLYLGGWTHLVHSEGWQSLRDILGIPRSRCLLLDRFLLQSTP
ncbi:MAG: hypothetical protein LLG06_14580 [Desulfobacteraceae bacterium]|nr:hypothetical protein [Desulfobacteraceae bacterium]